MACRYAARLRNCHHIGRRLRRLLTEGYIVFNEDGERVQTVEFRGFGDKSIGLTIDNVVFMDSNIDLDNGIHTPIEEFSSLFENWRAVHPDNFESLV